MTPHPIQDLLSDLDRELVSDPRGPGVVRLLQTYATEHDDWRRYAHFTPDHHARNLVRRTDLFELIVLCWNEGQPSAIHDHAGQLCWMAVLDGTMQETLFDSPSEDPGAPPRGRLTRQFDPGQVCYINDDIALHDICPLNGPGITLHLYANPISTCRTFDRATGQAETRSMRYNSIEGQVVSTPGLTPEPLPR
jgi:cysteine dioxygenase